MSSVKRHKAASFAKAISRLTGGMCYLLIIYGIFSFPITIFLAIASVLVFWLGAYYLFVLPRFISQTIASIEDVE